MRIPDSKTFGTLIRLAVIAVLACLTIPTTASAQAAKAQQRREALEVLRDLRQLSDAALGPDTPTDFSANTPIETLFARLGRPTRQVVAVDLSPADLDRMLETPTTLIDDEAFLRRARLDLTGTLPRPDEIEAFNADSDPHKRERLIDALLASDEFARHWARYWRDTIAFRATAENPRLVNFDVFETWMADALHANRPWDQIVSDILTASGEIGENGATALYVAHSTNQKFQPVEMAGEASRIFLGVQIACAQCHDHPTDRWTQQQFHELAAFFAGATVRRTDPQAPRLQRTLADRPGVPRHAMPDNNDPKKTTPVQPAFFLDDSESSLPRLDSTQSRALAASYFTGQDNPWFARAFVNRVWYALMGQAFYFPVDDLGPDRKAENAEVLDALADAFSRGGYDVRWLYQTITRTAAYQRADRPTPAPLRADAIFDALMTSLDLPLEGLSGRVARNDKNGKPAPQAPVGVRGRFGPRQIFGSLFGVDPSVPNEEVLGTIPQALFLMNSAQIQRGTQAAGPRSVLGRILSAQADNTKALDAVYLQTLARHPNADEQRVALDYLKKVGNRREAFEDILWALVNSTEFLTRR